MPNNIVQLSEDEYFEMLRKIDVLRIALEQIAIGDAVDPLQRSWDALYDSGLWVFTTVKPRNEI